MVSPLATCCLSPLATFAHGIVISSHLSPVAIFAHRIIISVFTCCHLNCQNNYFIWSLVTCCHFCHNVYFIWSLVTFCFVLPQDHFLWPVTCSFCHVRPLWSHYHFSLLPSTLLRSFSWVMSPRAGRLSCSYIYRHDRFGRIAFLTGCCRICLIALWSNDGYLKQGWLFEATMSIWSNDGFAECFIFLLLYLKVGVNHQQFTNIIELHPHRSSGSFHSWKN